MRNWGGNYTYRAGRLHRPVTLDELRRIVARAPRIRVLGARHAFSNIADSAELVTLDALPADVVVNRDAGTVSLGAGMTYGALATALACEHLALANLASSPQIGVGGAIATATHGSGDASGNLATAVAGMELVTSTGEAVTVRRGDTDFDGLVVGLGATGVVTRVLLDIEPAYEVSQRVFEGLGWDVLFEQFDAVFASGDSVSLFTRWGDAVDQLWVKRRITGAPDRAGDDLFGARPAASDRHPIPGMRPGQLHRAARPAGPVVGTAAALPDRLHAERGSGDPVGVPPGAAPCPGGDRGAARPGQRDPSAAVRQRDPHGRGGSTVDEPAVRT